MEKPNIDENVRRKSNVIEPIFSRYFLRHLSKPVTKVLMRTKITPNQITVIFVSMFLVAAVMPIDQTHRWVPIASGILFWLAFVLDAVDGEIARGKKIFSVKGVYLDMVAHRLVHAILFAATGIGLYLRDGEALPLLLAIGAIFGELSFTLILYAKWRALLDYPELLIGEVEKIRDTPKDDRKRLKTGFEKKAKRNNPIKAFYHVWFGKDYVGAVFFTTLVLSIIDQNIYLLWIYGIFTPIRALWFFFRRMVQPFHPDLV